QALANETPTNVIFHGWLDNDSPRLRELFESASIFVFPSEAENFPTVLLEAMDAGLAIVTTNVKGCPEVIGPAGLTVPPRSPEALRDAVQGLIRDPERRLSLGRQAHARVRAEFDWSVVERQYEALYGAVANATT
ncbi:MAG: glycosyltransferase family 4 protein, partial [Armatimonadia bacterium]